MSHAITRNLVILTTILASFAARADRFRWGGNNKNNRNGSTYLTPSNGRCYLYLGEAKTVKSADEQYWYLDLSGLTYVCDATAYSTSDSRFGNFEGSGKSLFESDLISKQGEQKYSIIVVATGKYTPEAGGLWPGDYTTVAIRSGTMSWKTESDYEYASMVATTQIVDGEFTKTLPVRVWDVSAGDGGYVCGNKDGNTGYIPPGGISYKISSKNARMFLYKGLAAIDDRGVIDLGRLTYVGSYVSTTYGPFGNYDSGNARKKANLYESNVTEPKDGDDYSILVVTTDNSKGTITVPLADYQTNNYVAVYQCKSVRRQSTDKWMYAEILMNKQIIVGDYNKGESASWSPMVFFNHMEYPPESPYATIKIPKSYLVERFPGMTDAEIAAASIAPRTEGNKCTILDSYVLGLDPDDAQSIPTVLPAQGSSGNKLQLNVSNVTVNPKANADVKYGLVSSASPDFSDPTQEVAPQESPALEGDLPTSGVKYYRADLTIQGK